MQAAFDSMDKSVRHRLILPGELMLEVLRFSRCEDIETLPLVSRRFLSIVGDHEEELPARQVLSLIVDSKSMKLWKGTELVDTVGIKRRSSTNHIRDFTSLYLDHHRDSIRSVKLNFGDATDSYVADLFTYFPPLRFVKDIFVSNDLSPYATFPTENVLNMLQMTKCLTRLELESVPCWFDWSILSLPEFRLLSRLCILRASSHDEVILRSCDADELLTFSLDFSAVDSKTVRAPCFRLTQKCHKKLAEVLAMLDGRSLTLEQGSSLRSARKEDNPYSALDIAAEFETDIGTEVTRYESRDGKVLFIDDGERFVGTNDAAKVKELANADQVPSV